MTALRAGPGRNWGGLWAAAIAIAALTILPGPARAQPDSVRADILEKKGFPPTHSPRGALWRAAALPGWGQWYNRQYYKIPFVYAGLGGLGYLIYRMNRRYRLFQRAHLFVIGRQRAGEGQPNQYQRFQPQYDRVTARAGGELSGSQLRQQRDRYRRWRDLSVVGVGLFYALTLVDAYVSAHLLTFDVGENLSLNVRPTGIDGNIQGGPGIRARLRF